MIELFINILIINHFRLNIIRKGTEIRFINKIKN